MWSMTSESWPQLVITASARASTAAAGPIWGVFMAPLRARAHGSAPRVTTLCQFRRPTRSPRTLDFMAPLKQKADLAELMVAADLRRRGYRIAIPFGEDCDYDLVVERHSRLERVQVKYA